MKVPELRIGESVAGIFETSGKPIFFKVRPPEAGEDILIALDRMDPAGWSEAFVGCERAPTEQDFCMRSQEWNEPHATVTIPNASFQWYYLELLARSLPGGQAAFTLRADILEYSLSSVGLKKGSNAGYVTLPLYGAKFRPGMKAWLVGTDSVRHEALMVIFGDSTTLYALFDLRGMAPGLYDVYVERNGVERALTKAFEIVSGTAGQLETRVLMPERVRVGRQFTVWIEYVNTGGTDLVAPIISVESPTGAQLKLRPEEEFWIARSSSGRFQWWVFLGSLGPGNQAEFLSMSCRWRGITG